MPTVDVQARQKAEVLEQYYSVLLDHSTMVLRGTFGNMKYGCYAIVAVVNTKAGDWACYIGVAPKEESEDSTLCIVAEHGHKMSEKEAETWFRPLFTAGLRYRQ